MSAIKDFYHDQICEGLELAKEEQMDQKMITEYEERKKLIIESGIPFFFAQDPSAF